METIPCVDHLSTPPTVGRIYRVRCVQLRAPDSLGPVARALLGAPWVPTLGTMHRDPDLGAPDEHIHLDLSFLALAEQMLMGPYLPLLFFQVLGRSYIQRGPELRPRMCVREMPPYPGDVAGPLKPTWLPGLEQRYAGTCLRDGHCPHKGAYVKNQPVRCVAGRLVQVCPNHGLAFDAETGALVPRA